MATKVKVLPKIEYPGAIGYLLWLRRDQPVLYKAALAKFPAVKLFENAVQQESNNLGDFSDVFSSISDTVGSSLSSIGSFLSTNAVPLLTAGAGVYMATKQADIAQAQLQLAQTQRPPQQTGVAYTAQGQPYVVPVQQNYPSLLNPSAGFSVRAAPVAYNSGAILGVPVWVWAAGAAGLVAVVLLSRR